MASSTAAPQQTPLYGGDEVSALVLDPGSYYTRIGFAGEDSPKVVLSTTYGWKENPNYDPEVLPDSESSAESDEKYIYYFEDDSSIHVPREGMEVCNPMEDGVIKDWEGITKLWEYGLKTLLHVNPEDHPLLITEQIWNNDEHRTKLMEIMFERFNVPAFYIIKSPVSSLFASGKGSGLVVDAGADMTTVTPIVDGLTLFKPSKRTKFAGNYLNEQILKMFKEKDITVTPRFMVQSKEPVNPNEPSKYQPKSLSYTPTESFKEAEIDRVVEEFKETCVGIEPEGTNAKQWFEFPDGYNQKFDKERLQVAEALFKSAPGAGAEEVTTTTTTENTNGNDKDKTNNDAAANNTKSDVETLTLTDRTTSPFAETGISDLIVNCINACDVDIRANLANNIVITGGTSFINGFTQRINQDLTQALAGLKIRIHAPGNSIERKNSSWIGGSILASLGTFHQLWISKKEYEQVGASKLLEKRFR